MSMILKIKHKKLTKKKFYKKPLRKCPCCKYPGNINDMNKIKWLSVKYYGHNN